MKKKEPVLYRKLTEYSREGAYPFHMPGHKRRTEREFPGDFPNPFAIDITEIEGFDDLHHAEGILKASMEWAASVYGTDRTFYLVNGSTCGVLAAVSAAARRGGTLLMARNSHRSAYNAAALRELSVRYVYPGLTGRTGIQGGIDAAAIEAELEQGGIDAVLLTSPTYEGVVTDIRASAEVCHRFGTPLIVDEAHGAHFPFGAGFPESAVSCGADAVIQSLHKTLPSLTQTALLHLTGPRIDADRIAQWLRVFETSSPSYVFMAGIERCIEYMDGQGRGEMDAFAGRLERLRGRLKDMRALHLPDLEEIRAAGGYDLDPARIVVSARGTELTGIRLAERLRRGYGLETEMSGPDYIVAITSLMDSEEVLGRLEDALFRIDRELAEAKEGRGSAAHPPEAEEERRLSGAKEPLRLPDAETALQIRPQVRLPLFRALECERRCVPLGESEGKTSGAYVYVYPPGIPVLAPGEAIGRRTVELIRTWRRLGMPVQGMASRENETVYIIE